mmetsp:Transcript_22934/g.27708  ORF Transcript_22934/g.27708 Transcript_22934/m.27708 type:complete len:88 (+) Transcript_22934:3-266(+)
MRIKPVETEIKFVEIANSVHQRLENLEKQEVENSEAFARSVQNMREALGLHDLRGLPPAKHVEFRPLGAVEEPYRRPMHPPPPPRAL